jgi:hypothetical protein
MDYLTLRTVAFTLLGIAVAIAAVPAVRLIVLKQQLDKNYWRPNTDEVLALRERLSWAIYEWEEWADRGLFTSFIVIAITSVMVSRWYP